MSDEQLFQRAAAGRRAAARGAMVERARAAGASRQTAYLLEDSAGVPDVILRFEVGACWGWPEPGRDGGGTLVGEDF